MPTTLTTRAEEGSTFVVHADFYDEDGDAVVPNELAWSLYDRAGNIVNSRDSVSLTPASAVDIVLEPNDLALSSSPLRVGAELRALVVVGTYDSGLGSDLPIAQECRFQVANSIGV